GLCVRLDREVTEQVVVPGVLVLAVWHHLQTVERAPLRILEPHVSRVDSSGVRLLDAPGVVVVKRLLIPEGDTVSLPHVEEARLPTCWDEGKPLLHLGQGLAEVPTRSVLPAQLALRLVSLLAALSSTLQRL